MEPPQAWRAPRDSMTPLRRQRRRPVPGKPFARPPNPGGPAGAAA